MDALVLAGGEGSRLASAGVPKPLALVGGEPLIARIVRNLSRLGHARITCMVRAEFAAAVRARLADVGDGPMVRIEPCSTPSSLHTLALGFVHVADGPVFCTMVDTFMAQADWRRVHAGIARALARGADIALAITPFVDDEAPLYAGLDLAGRITGFGRTPLGVPQVTGGVYGFAPAARLAAAAALKAGQQRLRTFLQSAVEAGMSVEGILVPRIVDLDRPEDLAVAERWPWNEEELG